MHGLLRSSLLVVALGCRSSAPELAPLVDLEPSEPGAEAIIAVRESSRPFLTVESVRADGGSSAIQAPARVAFRDGAVSEVGPPFAGRVVGVHVRTGDQVRRDDPLVTLDSPEAASVRTSMASATASLREARAALDRERRMLEKGVGIERDRLAAETRVSELEAELSRARVTAALAGTGEGATLILRAPIAGTVTRLNATVGMAFQQGPEPLLEIGDPSALWIVADVFERDLPLVREGARAVVEMPSLNGPIEGRVSSVGAIVTAGLRTAPVRVTLESDGRRLRPGMYGRVRIVSEGSGVTLPAEAVLIDGTASFVYVETAPLTFERRAVEVALPVAGQVHVLSGVSPGERVVVRGALLLDGAADQLL